jgi:arylsulfatase A-like enzyme
LIIRWPNKIKSGLKITEMVQNLDYAQTLLDMAGIRQPSDMQGESLVPLLFGNKSEWTRDAVYYHYYEYPSVHMVKRHYGIVTEKYKLVHFYYDVDEWELYDRFSDLNEMSNVYNDPNYSEIKTKLKIELIELRNKYNDSRELDQYYIKKYLE